MAQERNVSLERATAGNDSTNPVSKLAIGHFQLINPVAKWPKNVMLGSVVREGNVRMGMVGEDSHRNFSTRQQYLSCEDYQSSWSINGFRSSASSSSLAKQPTT
jgi:isocitrate dehydrogenase